MKVVVGNAEYRGRGFDSMEDGYVGVKNDFNCCKLATGCGTENAQKMLEGRRLAWEFDLE